MAIFSKWFKKDNNASYAQGLAKTQSSFGAKLKALSNRFRGIDQALLDELMVILLQADVGMKTSQAIVERFEKQGHELKQYPDLEAYFEHILVDFYQEIESQDMVLNEQGPTVIFMVGVNGAGKTTTTAKLAHLYQQEGLKVGLVAADTFRAGAIDQLKTWAERVGVPCIAGQAGQDPASVIMDGARFAQENGLDILLCDTAGRLQNKVNLMKELEKMTRVVKKVIPSAPHEVWLVLDATTGQNALIQAQEFDSSTSLTGLIVTKLDGTAKGGVVLAVHHQLGLPVRFLGLGEKLENLQPFDETVFVKGIVEGLDRG